jgi:hypothetical protein
LNRFAFQPVCNLSSSIRLAFASRCVLAFSYQLSVGSAFPIAGHFLAGKFGVSLCNRLRTPSCTQPYAEPLDLSQPDEALLEKTKEDRRLH